MGTTPFPWRSVSIKPTEGAKVKTVYCCPDQLYYSEAEYKNSSYWNGEILLDTPSYWRIDGGPEAEVAREHERCAELCDGVAQQIGNTEQQRESAAYLARQIRAG